MSLRPLIAIGGTTGVGKSNLAVELALARLALPGFPRPGFRPDLFHPYILRSVHLF